MATLSKSEQPLSPEDANGHSSRRTAGLVWITCGRIIQVAGYIITLFAIALWLGQKKPVDPYWVVASISLMFFGSAMAYTAVKCVQHGRKLWTYGPEEIMRNDPRPPVLYLRPFTRDSEAADAETIVSPPNYMNGSASTRGWLITRTEEEQLVHVLQSIGCVIALGNPENKRQDKLPELGAARRYLKHGKDWQDVVWQWMAQASVVALHAGTSPGLLCELQMARHMLSHEQLLILLSMNDEEYLRFKEKIERRWSIQFPDYMGQKVYGSMTGCIYFKPGWQPCFLQMKKSFFYGFSRRPLAPVLQRTIQPFFDQLEQVAAKSSRAKQENLRLAQERATKSQALSREGHITERFTKAIDQLRAVTEKGEEQLQIRLAGIYVLEQIARDSERDHWPIMEILTAYVREHTAWQLTAALPRQDDQSTTEPPPAKNEPAPPKPTADIHAILRILGRRTRLSREGEDQHLDLANTDLRGADLRDAHLEGADLEGAHLEGADFDGVKLDGAKLDGAHLVGARALTVKQLSAVKTLYQAQLDPPLFEQIQQQYPHLLEKPQN